MTVICDQSTRSGALPRTALVTLAAATMTMVTGEMLPTAVLAPISTGLGVSEARVGLLVSVWAATVVIVSLPLVRLTRGVDRHTLIERSLWVFAISALATAVAPTFGAAMAARTLGAAAVGVLWSTVNAHIAGLVDDELLGRATSIVLGGATLGMVIGTPVARFAADLAGWRAAFWGLAAASATVAVLVRRFVPGEATHAPTAGGAEHTARPRGPMLAVTALVAVALAGHYGVYTYITRITEAPAATVPGGTGGVLLLFGIASAAGVALAGRVQRLTRALVIATLATAMTVLALAAAERATVAGVAIVAAWGLASGALPPLAQTLVLRLAGAEHRALAGALIPVLFNGGIAVGAAAASTLVGAAGTDALPVGGALVVAAAAVGLATRRGAGRWA